MGSILKRPLIKINVKNECHCCEDMKIDSDIEPGGESCFSMCCFQLKNRQKSSCNVNEIKTETVDSERKTQDIETSENGKLS